MEEIKKLKRYGWQNGIVILMNLIIIHMILNQQKNISKINIYIKNGIVP